MEGGQRRVKERSAEMGKRFFSDTLILGMALFSMFFGAGNIIFPPYLGMESGSQWVAGFISYYMADIGLSVMAILALLKQRGRMEGVIGAIGRLPSKLMLSAMVLCIGPLIAVPRTGATTHEMFMTPIFGPMPPLVGSLIFFGVVFLLTIRESSVVDILGKFLTPALLLGLMVLILRGVISPMGEITDQLRQGSVVQNGISAGYQTMDSMAAVIFGIIIIANIRGRGYTEEKQQYRLAACASLAAAAGLLVVYGGLTYLGAAATGTLDQPLPRTELILYITRSLMGETGTVILGIVVALACITTAVALISASARHFSQLSGGRIGYGTLVAAFCLFSAVTSAIGTDRIVEIASPILSVLYPGMLALLVLSFFSGRVVNRRVIQGAVIGALLAGLCEQLYLAGLPLEFITWMPLAGYGFSWLLPAAVTGAAGGLIGRAFPPEEELKERSAAE